MRGWTIALIVSLIVVMIILFAVCNDDDSGDTTTTSAVTSTTAPEPTTTAPAPTTTSIVEATTTTLPETTTTADDGLLEGNWAPEPLVATTFMGALGWWDGTGWVQVEEGMALPVAGGEDYQVARLGTEEVITGGPEEMICEFVPAGQGVVFDEPETVEPGSSGPKGVAISAPWPLTPHLVEEIADDGTYDAAASALLAERGLDVPDPVIKQVVRFDLEGDGVNEVAVVAEDVPPSLLGEVGDYSIVFVQRVVDGVVQSLVLEEYLLVELEEGFIPAVSALGVGAVADLNADGRMELVIPGSYYEGEWMGVWEYVNDDLGFVAQITNGCGV